MDNPTTETLIPLMEEEGGGEDMFATLCRHDRRGTLESCRRRVQPTKLDYIGYYG